MPPKRNVAGDMLQAGRHRHNEREMYSHNMEDQCRPSEGTSLSINLAPDIHSKRDPTNFSGPNVNRVRFRVYFVFDKIPAIEILDVHKNIYSSLAGAVDA